MTSQLSYTVLQFDQFRRPDKRFQSSKYRLQNPSYSIIPLSNSQNWIPILRRWILLAKLAISIHIQFIIYYFYVYVMFEKLTLALCDVTNSLFASDRIFDQYLQLDFLVFPLFYVWNVWKRYSSVLAMSEQFVRIRILIIILGPPGI